MTGTLHIFRIDPEHEPADKLEPQYQANFNTPGNNYARVCKEAELKDFLRYVLDLQEAGVMRVIDRLHETRKATLSDVDIPVDEAGMLGLEQLPSDG